MSVAESDLEYQDRSVLGRAAIIINSFDVTEPVLSLNQLTHRTGLPRSTVHRFAEQLVVLGWLERVAAGYRVGMKLFEVGTLVSNLNRLRNSASPWMQRLHETYRLCVHLGILDGAEVVYVDKIAPRGMNLPTRTGGRMPAHCTALGKVMLAYGTKRDLDRVISEGLDARTPHTMVSPVALQAKLAEIRETGVAVDMEEAVRGIVCVAAPIRGSGRAVAAVSITGPREGFDLPRVARSVRAAADAIWAEMFGTVTEEPPRKFSELASQGSPSNADASGLDTWALQFQLGDWL